MTCTWPSRSPKFHRSVRPGLRVRVYQCKQEAPNKWPSVPQNPAREHDRHSRRVIEVVGMISVNCNARILLYAVIVTISVAVADLAERPWSETAAAVFPDFLRP